MLGNGNPICDAIDHRWLEEYYGYKCENCGAFVPYGSEPWLDDDDAEQSFAADSSVCSGCGHIDGYHPLWCMAGE